MPPERFSFERPDTTLAGWLWAPEIEPTATIMLLHGMGEHAQRYERIANRLVAQGFVVYAHDHRGHGASAENAEARGYFADADGWDKCISDVCAHLKQIRSQHPEIPHFLFGHSMGSFMAQEVTIRESEQLHGVILSGSNGKPNVLARVGYGIAVLERLRLGKRGRSRILDKLSFDDFNRTFQPTRTRFDWLSRDEEEVDKYIADESCGFMSTAQLWKDLLGGISHMSKPERQQQIRPDLPVYVFSGSRDPVGLETRGVRQLLQAWTEAGLTKITYTFYNEGRHEMLNEINREEVEQEIVDWLEQTMPNK